VKQEAKKNSSRLFKLCKRMILVGIKMMVECYLADMIITVLRKYKTLRIKMMTSPVMEVKYLTNQILKIWILILFY
jgi:hypothetical protein